ncbi:MBL fold metallo-hydrolase [Desulfopila sp. IMCC35008]|uniref:MBL fold metallo-hydrolase n=1 Tax=Desulfopila sp. IMCC35008 TaxID=2653858 RepID=UPI0013CF5DC9|nr:MBL fold metallo-hydrolase [Desulfopila sp. IMCC35008]
MTNKRICILCLVVICFFISAYTLMADEGKLAPTQVTSQIYMLSGKGGNVGVFMGDDGTFLIDDNFAPMTESMVKTIKSLGGTHPRFLINTHYHADHTGGNENIGQGGTLIFSHDNVRERLVTGSYLEPFEAQLEPTQAPGLPVVTFSEGISFHINGETVAAIHVGHAHTDGDSFIIFENANIIHAGDLFFNGFYPFIDVHHGGSLKGMIRGVEELMSLSDDNTRIIPGHGPLADKNQLRQYQKMLQTAYDRLRVLKADGYSAKDAAEENPLADLEEEWGDGLFKGSRWIEIIYPGI